MTVLASGCARRQPQPVADGLSLPIRECVRNRMTAAGLQVTDQANARVGNLGPGRALVGRSAAESGSLNQAVGPVDFLTVWYSDSSFTPLGWTVQMDNTRGSLGGTQLLKSTRLRDLEEKLARECRGYRAAKTGGR